VNPVRRSSTFQREGTHGALNPVFAPLRDKSLTGFAPKRILSSSPLRAPLEVGYQREPLINNEKFLTGRAAGLSNGVNTFKFRLKEVISRRMI